MLPMTASSTGQQWKAAQCRILYNFCLKISCFLKIVCVSDRKKSEVKVSEQMSDHTETKKTFPISRSFVESWMKRKTRFQAGDDFKGRRRRFCLLAKGFFKEGWTLKPAAVNKGCKPLRKLAWLKKLFLVMSQAFVMSSRHLPCNPV